MTPSDSTWRVWTTVVRLAGRVTNGLSSPFGPHGVETGERAALDRPPGSSGEPTRRSTGA
ncbi:hypothetical protein ACSHWB_36700 [Lentzea sp. HUAS TT2]|uniref:hypothetical protein n=1 Tax=Lentzea sp. HUAS TT2 TaxID=3447454 RepID=UPI003F7024F9